MRTIKEVEAELRELKAAERVRKEAEREANQPEMKYSILPAVTTRGHRSYDSTCRFYTLRGRVVNVEAAKAAGWRVEHMQGSMDYIYNTLTEKIVCAVGGGRMFVSNNYLDENDHDKATFARIGAFLSDNPEGGDITEIVNEFRKATRAVRRDR